MSDTGGILGEVLEQGGSLVKQTVKQVAKTPGDLAKAGSTQVKGASLNQGSVGQAEEVQSDIDEKKQTAEFVKDIYKPLDTSKQVSKNTENPEETKEQKLAKLRQELHRDYYQKLVNPPKAPEEKPAERVERQKNEERWELEQKEKKKPTPIAAQRAAQRTEKFPGASG